jgi:FtsH-binding integral membrane protein
MSTESLTIVRLVVCAIGLFAAFVIRRVYREGEVDVRLVTVLGAAVLVGLLFSLVIAWGFKAKWSWLVSFLVVLACVLFSIAFADYVVVRR